MSHRRGEIQRLIAAYATLADFGEPVPEAVIAAAEQELAVAFPPSYRWFVAEYGCGGFRSQEFYGLGIPATGIPSVVWATWWQRNADRAFPQDFVVVQNEGLGEVFCLQTATTDPAGECRIVRWIPGLAVGLQDLEVIATDFLDLLLMELREEIRRHTRLT